ncbi:hypothetical protein D3C72_948130 [compost metagenome]
MYCSPGILRSTASRPIGSSIDPPTPCSTRAITSCVSVWAVAQYTEPSTKIRMAQKYTRRVPNLSASQPEAGVSIAMVSVYATTTGFRSSGFSPRLCAIEGSAVLTMVVSSVCMKKPAKTIHSMAFCEATAGLAGAGAVVMGILCNPWSAVARNNGPYGKHRDSHREPLWHY